MKTRALSLLALAAALAGPPSFAAAPHTLAVQGRLTDDTGTPLTGAVTVTFRIHDALEGGSVDFTETEVVALSDEGVFAATLGDDAAALDPALFGASRWLSVEVNGGGELAPRTALVPAPYAHRAVSAETLAPTTTVQMGGEALTGLPSPAADADAATKGYADSGDDGLQTQLDAHTGDGTIHFTQGAISITSAQVSDFEAAVSGSAHASDGSIHFLQSSISITGAQVSDLDSRISTSTHALDTGNPHAVTKAQVGLGNLQDIQSNLAATVAPTGSNDDTEGYAVGSRWVDPRARRPSCSPVTPPRGAPCGGRPRPRGCTSKCPRST